MGLPRSSAARGLPRSTIARMLSSAWPPRPRSARAAVLVPGTRLLHNPGMGSSTWTTARGPVEHDAVVVHVHGEDDDALRIVAELAAAAGDAHERRVCLTPASSWRDRHKAAARLLERQRASASPKPLVIVDPDALPGRPDAGDARWDDRSFSVPRHQVRALLLAHATSTENVTFVRPRPEHELTSELGAGGILPADEPEDALGDIMPFARPLARWLIGRETLTERSLSHWVQTLEEPALTDLVVGAAYESLSSEARAALARLAVLRGPQRLNGVAGPFALDDGEGALSLARSAVMELRTAGWLQPAVGAGVELPNALRSFASARARLMLDLEPVHRAVATLALPELERRSVPEVVEAHHHAIAGGDPELALRTGRYFVNDLRRLAFELSTREEDYAAAAELYRAIIAEDDADAYAHEYLAYNLHQAAKGAPSDEVLAHYDRARQLERDNPLFIGRWLACRASRGENVTTELKKYIRRFNQTHGSEAVSYLAKTPLLVMRREHRAEVARGWGRLLERIPELRSLLG